MKKIKIILAFCLIVSMAKSQNSYGILSYSHTNAYLGSGSATYMTPGFLMAGFSRTNTQALYNFTIDKMDAGGAVTSLPNYFQNGYQLFGDFGCSGGYPQILNCSGVTAIETPSASQKYAVVGAVDFGCFFTTLNSSGTPVVTTSFIFPGTPTFVTKPLITQSVGNQNNFYITGAYDGIMYILEVNSSGSLLAQYSPSVSPELMPTAIIESPYGTDIVIVGVAKTGTNNNAFFYQIANTLPTFGASVFQSYDMTTSGNSDNGFTSLTVANSTVSGGAGFLLGGFTESSNGSFPGKAWMLKLDPTGNLLWNTIIEGSTDNVTGKVHAVVERLSTFNGIYENYGACANNSGITIYKLDDFGVPFSMSIGGQDEFVYNTGSSSTTWPVSMTCNNINLGLPDEGLHIFGNLNNSGPGNYYFVEAYFNGVEGCNTPVNILNYDNGTPTITPITDSQGSTLTPCPSFSISTTSINAFNAICGPAVSVGGGSNNKAAPVGIEAFHKVSQDFVVSPNPITQNAEMTYSLNEISNVNIELYNYLGQFLTTLDVSKNVSAGEHKINIDFNSLNLSGGVYFIKASLNNTVLNQKVIYTK